MDIVESNISRSINAKTHRNVPKGMSNDAFTPVFITTWETANMGLIATSRTLSEDKLSDLIPNPKHAKSFITKTFALLGINAKIHMICESTLASTIRLKSVSSRTRIADTRTRRKWMCQSSAFLI